MCVSLEQRNPIPVYQPMIHILNDMLVSLDMCMDRQQDYSEILYQYFTNANKQKTQHQSRFVPVIELPDVLATVYLGSK